MKVVPAGWTVVVLGAWNVAILNPEWLAKHLFGGRDVKVEIPIGQPFSLLRVTADRVRITTAPDKVIFSPVEIDDAALTNVEASACALLELLHHTPVAAIGINFTFAEEEPGPDLLAHFSDGDLDKIVELGYVSEAVSLTRHLKFGAGAQEVLNLKARAEGRGLHIEFNFHRDVSTPAAAVEAIRGRVLEYRNLAQTLLSSVYGLKGEDDVRA